MLSRILHRNKPPVKTNDLDLLKTFKDAIHNKKLTYDQVNNFYTFINKIDSETQTKVLDNLMFANINTSYVEPYIEAGYAFNIANRDKLVSLYIDNLLNSVLENKTNIIFSKLLDDRFYDNYNFPIHAFAALASSKIDLPNSRHAAWLEKALSSQIDINQIKFCLNQWGINPNDIKDSYNRTILHKVCSYNISSSNSSELLDIDRLLARCKELGIASTKDIFGREPQELARFEIKNVYNKYYDINTTLNDQLHKYLNDTLHNYNSIYAVNSKNNNVYIKSDNPNVNAKQISLFEHILNSQNTVVFNQLVDVIKSGTSIEKEIENTMSFILLDRITDKNKPQLSNDFIENALTTLENNSMKELSTALGCLLMKSNNYFEYQDKDLNKLSSISAHIEKIVNYQQERGLTELIEREQIRLNTLNINSNQSMSL